MSNFDIDRMLRLNGKEPTVRERWTAFYRLYRMAKKIDIFHEHDAADCLRVLGFGYEVAVANEEERPPRGGMPKFLRKMLIESERRLRIARGGE